ncbi:MAG: redoxin family protein [Clostridia bacterium]|nr:redoxin family protein [Clostridia bacterium]
MEKENINAFVNVSDEAKPNESESVENSLNSVENDTQNAEITDTPPQKKKKRGFKEKIKAIIPSKRKLIQLYAALLTNAHIKGYITGSIYMQDAKTGASSKFLCSPGLNCYSCPGAVGACPLGGLQSELNSANRSGAFYVLAIIMLYGLILGRMICGWLCPFGLVQELLYKIKTPKVKKSKFTRILSYLKYPIFLYFVVFIPIMYGMASSGVQVPGFCKFICPAGILGGAIGLLPNNGGYLGDLGPLFTWKFCLMIGFLLACVFIFRFFCRFFCPLGLFYGFFNKFSFLGVKVEKDKCTSCGLCVSKCKMDIKHVGDIECISCGECVDVCPTKAIRFKGTKIFLPPDEIDTADMNESEAIIAKQENEAKRAKAKKRAKIFKIVTGSLMAIVMVFALIYYNFIYNPPSGVGSGIGDHAPSIEMEVFDENGLVSGNGVSGNGYSSDDNGTLLFDPSKNDGKITIVNFWGTWCPGCVNELPYFDQIASEYKDSVTVVAIHTDYIKETGAAFVLEGYKDSNIIFAFDKPHKEIQGVDQYFTDLGGKDDAYPMTVVFDENGIIIARFESAVHYEDLKTIVDNELNS